VTGTRKKNNRDFDDGELVMEPSVSTKIRKQFFLIIIQIYRSGLI